MSHLVEGRTLSRMLTTRRSALHYPWSQQTIRCRLFNTWLASEWVPGESNPCEMFGTGFAARGSSKLRLTKQHVTVWKWGGKVCNWSNFTLEMLPKCWNVERRKQIQVNVNLFVSSISVKKLWYQVQAEIKILMKSRRTWETPARLNAIELKNLLKRLNQFYHYPYCFYLLAPHSPELLPSIKGYFYQAPSIY